MPIADQTRYCDFNLQTMMEVSLYIKSVLILIKTLTSGWIATVMIVRIYLPNKIYILEPCCCLAIFKLKISNT